MAIIKCPECGRQISDKAPTCPNCGVEIAGKVTKCPDCYNVYFKDEEMCPNCHRHNDEYIQPSALEEAPKTATPPPHPPVVPTVVQQPKTSGNSYRMSEEPKKKSHVPLVVSVVIAAIICAICFYFYQKANNDKEMKEYEFAMQSSDPLVLQSYLDTFTAAPGEHRDSIAAHLNAIIQGDREWTNAVVSGSKTAIEDYLKNHPNTSHTLEARHKIDSLDWVAAMNLNTPESLKEYLNAHPDGEHYAEVQQQYDKVNSTIVSPADETMIKALFKKYFQSINAKDENSLVGTVSTILKTFLGKENANQSDVIGFLHKLYKEDISNMIFNLNNDFKIDKKPSDTGGFEYNVNFSTGQLIERGDRKENNRYRIRATVTPEGKISGFNMVKIVEQPAEPKPTEAKPTESKPAETKPAAKPAEKKPEQKAEVKKTEPKKDSTTPAKKAN